MTDGTTGFHVAPIPQDAIDRVEHLLNRTADAIVQISHLTAEVAELLKLVAGHREAAEAHATALSQAEKDRDWALGEIEHLGQANDQAFKDLTDTKKELDAANLRIKELEDTLAGRETMLTKIADIYHQAGISANRIPAE